MRSSIKGCKSFAALLILLCLLAACSDAPAATTVPTTAPSAAIPTLASTVADAVADATPGTQPAGSTDSESSSTDTTYAGLPDTLAGLLPNADVVHGGELAVQQGCTACHSLDKDMRVIGPSFYDVGQVAAARVAGEGAAFYLYNSIIHPNQYVVETFLPGLMPQTYGEQLSEQDLADLIAYLLTRQGE